MEQNNKQNIILNTIGRDRTDCIESMKTITRQNDYNNYQHLRVENERYYDSLDDDAKPKNDLKNKWDIISTKKNEMLMEWEINWKKSDVAVRHDLIEQKKAILWWYEKERAMYAEMNYHYFKTYWEENDEKYPLE